MDNFIRIAEVTVKVIGFIIAEVIPFGRAIQKVFKNKTDATELKK